MAHGRRQASSPPAARATKHRRMTDSSIGAPRTHKRLTASEVAARRPLVGPPPCTPESDAIMRDAIAASRRTAGFNSHTHQPSVSGMSETPAYTSADAGVPGSSYRGPLRSTATGLESLSGLGETPAPRAYGPIEPSHVHQVGHSRHPQLNTSGPSPTNSYHAPPLHVSGNPATNTSRGPSVDPFRALPPYPSVHEPRSTPAPHHGNPHDFAQPGSSVQLPPLNDTYRRLNHVNATIVHSDQLAQIANNQSLIMNQLESLDQQSAQHRYTQRTVPNFLHHAIPDPPPISERSARNLSLTTWFLLVENKITEDEFRFRHERHKKSYIMALLDREGIDVIMSATGELRHRFDNGSAMGFIGIMKDVYRTADERAARDRMPLHPAVAREQIAREHQEREREVSQQAAHEQEARANEGGSDEKREDDAVGDADSDEEGSETELQGPQESTGVA